MAYYKPCKNCAVEKATCPRRREVAAGISRLSITVVNFRCGQRQPLFRSGQRVQFAWTSWESDGYEDSSVDLLYHGTVIEENGLRFIVRVDDGPSACSEQIAARDVFKNDSLVIKVKPSDMKALDESDRILCPSCSAYEGEDARCQGWEDPGFHSYWPDGCFKAGRKVHQHPPASNAAGFSAEYPLPVSASQEN